MKIYFSGSIRGGREDAALYRELIEELQKYGEVLTEHVGSSQIGHTLTDREIHDRDMRWLKEADIIIAEVTTPSLGVGYEIGRAIEMGKRIICLYRNVKEKQVSAMIKGAPDLTYYSYTNIKTVNKLFCRIFAEKE